MSAIYPPTPPSAANQSQSSLSSHRPPSSPFTHHPSHSPATATNYPYTATAAAAAVAVAAALSTQHSSSPQEMHNQHHSQNQYPANSTAANSSRNSISFQPTSSSHSHSSLSSRSPQGQGAGIHIGHANIVTIPSHPPSPNEDHPLPPAIQTSFMSQPSNSPSMPAALAAPSNPLSAQLQSLSLPPRMQFPKERYQKIRTIRQTLMGKVALYVDTTTNRKVAIKLSDKQLLAKGKTTTGNKVAENPLEEIRIMNILNGNLIKNGVIVNDLPLGIREGFNFVLTSLGEYEDDSYLYTILPFCGKGEFFDIVCRETRFSEKKARHYFIQMLKGVRFMHTLTMVHLDLSLENLLMTDDDILKICDYGLTRHLTVQRLDLNDGTSRYQIIPFQGTNVNKPGKLGYMAPEIFSSQSFSGTAADVWSMGVVLFISLFGVPPYQVPASTDQRFQLIHTGRIITLLQAWHMDHLVSAEAIDLMAKMLCPEQNRISIDEIFKHPWIRAGLPPETTPIPIPIPSRNNNLGLTNGEGNIIDNNDDVNMERQGSDSDQNQMR